MDWVAEYLIMLMHYIFRLTLDLNNWYISVEEETGDIEVPNLSDIRFKLDRRISNLPNIPVPCGMHSPSTTLTSREAPSPAPELYPDPIRLTLHSGRK